MAADWRTGLALGGFDPVSYFAGGQPAPGVAEFEQAVRGATWRFRNAGNMAAFAADPEAYAPRFGGYDPIILARGVATAGNPRVWRIHDGRLVLFFDEQSRLAFVRDPYGALGAAERAWPGVLKGLGDAAGP